MQWTGTLLPDPIETIIESVYIEGLPTGFGMSAMAMQAVVNACQQHPGDGLGLDPTAPNATTVPKIWIQAPATGWYADDLQLVLMSGETGLTATH